MCTRQHTLSLGAVLDMQEFCCVGGMHKLLHMTCVTGVPAKSLEDSIVRLLMRMLLLYIQQAPVHRANHCVQQALVLLPVLLGSEVDTLNR